VIFDMQLINAYELGSFILRKLSTWINTMYVPGYKLHIWVQKYICT
jgi:hypothetical protein